MKLTYRAQRNLAFLLILAIGLSYLAFLLVTSPKVLSGCVMQLISLGEYLRSPQGDVTQLIFSSHFLIHIIAGSILLGLLAITGIGLIASLTKLIATQKAVARLPRLDSHRVHSWTLGPGKNGSYYVFEAAAPAAFTAGLLRPQIYLSKNLLGTLSPEKLEAILRHEQQHQLNLDPLKDLIVNTIKLIIPPFPNKTQLFNQYGTLVELACDQFAEQRLRSKRPLIEALLDLIHLNKAGSALLPTSFTTHSERVAVLSGKQTFRARKLFLTGILLTGTFLAVTTVVSSSTALAGCEYLHNCLESFFDDTSYCIYQQPCL